MTKSTKNVFISHIHKDDSGLDKLVDLLKSHNMDARNFSITSDKENNAKSPNYIKNEILAPRIDACGTLVVYLSPSTKESKWVDWEIEYAFKKGKTIVGVWEYGSTRSEIPEALEEYGDAIVGWNGENIVAAINGECKVHENPDGTLKGAAIPIVRHPCA